MKPTQLFACLFLASSLALAGCAADSVDQDDESSEEAISSTGGRFQIFKGLDDQHYFHVIAANGQLVLRSEGYSSKQKAQQGLDSVRNNAPDRSAYDVREARNGSWYFNLKAANHQVIGTSQMYATKSNAERGANAVAKIVRRANQADARMVARFQTFKGLDDQRYFNLRAANGEIVLQSEGYASTQGADNGIASVKENGVLESAYEVLEAADGQFYFRLKAANGEIIAHGETYASRSGATRGMAAVIAILKADARLAPNDRARIPTGAAD